MQFKKLRRNDRKRNNRKEDSGFVIELLVAPKFIPFTGEILAQHTLYMASASLAVWISRSCPFPGTVPLPARASLLWSLTAVVFPG